MNIFRQLEIIENSCNILFFNRLSENFSSNNSISISYTVDVDLAKYGNNTRIGIVNNKSSELKNF